jgi:hypothetical protein
MVRKRTRSHCARNKFLRAAPWRPNPRLSSARLPTQGFDPPFSINKGLTQGQSFIYGGEGGIRTLAGDCSPLSI